MTKNIILLLFYTNLSIKSTPKRFQLAHLVIFFVNISHFIMCYVYKLGLLAYISIAQ